MLISSNSVSSALTGATPSSTLPSTVLASSSCGSCGRNPTVMPSAGNASPVNDVSRPAMILSNVLLPAPL